MIYVSLKIKKSKKSNILCVFITKMLKTTRYCGYNIVNRFSLTIKIIIHHVTKVNEKLKL